MLATCVTSADRHQINGQIFIRLAFLNIEDPFFTVKACMYLFIYFDLDELCLGLVFGLSKCFKTFWILFLFPVLSEGVYSVNAAFST